MKYILSYENLDVKEKVRYDILKQEGRVPLCRKLLKKSREN